MTIKESLKEIEDKINLSKRFPGYFNKWIFRGAIVIMLLLILIIVALEGIGVTDEYLCIECNSHMKCENPFYICEQQAKDDLKPGSFVKPDYIMNCDQFNAFDCEGNICEKEFLEPGESIGRCPGPLFQNFKLIVVGIMIFAFYLNHRIWMYRRKKQ